MRIDRKNLFQAAGYVESNYGHQVEAHDTNTPFKDSTAQPWLLELLSPSAAGNVFKNLLDVDVSKDTTLKEDHSEDISGNLLAATTYQQAAEGYYLAEATDDIFYTDVTDLWQTENNNGSDEHLQEATDITYVLDSFCHASSSAEEVEMEKCLVGDSVQSRLKEVLQRRKLAEGVQDVKTDIVPVKRKRVEVDECPPVTNKKLRRQTQNRNAARRFREKQRSTIQTLSMKSDALKEVNTKLRNERSFFLRQRDELKKHLDRHLKLCPRIANASAAPADHPANDTGVGNLPINQVESEITPPFLTEGKILVEVEYQGKTVLEEETLVEITQLLGTSWPQLASEHAVNLVVNSTGSCVQGEVKPDEGGNNLQDSSGFTTVMLTPDHSPECGRTFNYTVKGCGDSSADYLATSLPHTPEASPADHNQCSSVFTFDDENDSGPSGKASSPSVPQTPSQNLSPVPVPSNGDINGQQAEGGKPDLFTLLEDFEPACVDIWKYNNGLSELSTPVLLPIIDHEKVTPGVKVKADVWESITPLTSDWSGIALTDFRLNSEELAAYSFPPDDHCASLDRVR